jgi:hypothetical protein
LEYFPSTQQVGEGAIIPVAQNRQLFDLSMHVEQTESHSKNCTGITTLALS